MVGNQNQEIFKEKYENWIIHWMDNTWMTTNMWLQIRKIK